MRIIKHNLLPTHLSTNRIKFRLLKLSDAKIWDSFIADKTAQKFLKVDVNDVNASKSWIKNQHRRYNTKLGGLMIVESKLNGKLIGQAGLLIQTIDDKNHIEVGYHIIPKYRQRGYASEAAITLIDYVFDSNLSDSIISLIHINNIASQKVAEKNGLLKKQRITFHNFPVFIYELRKENHKAI